MLGVDRASGPARRRAAIEGEPEAGHGIRNLAQHSAGSWPGAPVPGRRHARAHPASAEREGGAFRACSEQDRSAGFRRRRDPTALPRVEVGDQRRRSKAEAQADPCYTLVRSDDPNASTRCRDRSDAHPRRRPPHRSRGRRAHARRPVADPALDPLRRRAGVPARRGALPRRADLGALVTATRAPGGPAPPSSLARRPRSGRRRPRSGIEGRPRWLAPNKSRKPSTRGAAGFPSRPLGKHLPSCGTSATGNWRDVR